jgi:hypothetical protein
VTSTTFHNVAAGQQEIESRPWTPSGFLIDMNAGLDFFFDDETLLPNQHDLNGFLNHSETGAFYMPANRERQDLASAALASDITAPQPERSSQQSPSFLGEIPRGLPSLINGIESNTEQRFFCHFTNVTSRVLTLSTGKDNPLLMFVLPRSLQDPMIQRALLCLGGSHLTNELEAHGSETPSFMAQKKRMLQEAEEQQATRFSALKVLESGNSRRPIEFEAVLTTALLLCLYEISEGKGDKLWQVHLDAARHLIRDALEVETQNHHHKQDGYDHQTTGWSPDLLAKLHVDRFLLEFFIYHDVLAGVTDNRSRQSPVLEPPSSSSSSRRFLLWQPSSRSSGQVYMIDVNNGPLDLISRIAALRSQAMTHGLTSAVICEAVLLWQDLSGFQPQTADQEQVLAFSSYIPALFIWLYSIIYPDNITDQKVQTTLKQVIRDMKEIQTSGVLAFLLFPTFILGLASVDAEDRQEIEVQFDRLAKFSGLGNIKLACEVVKRSWAEYTAGNQRSWDWMKQMEIHGISLPLT